MLRFISGGTQEQSTGLFPVFGLTKKRFLGKRYGSEIPEKLLILDPAYSEMYSSLGLKSCNMF